MSGSHLLQRLQLNHVDKVVRLARAQDEVDELVANAARPDSSQQVVVVPNGEGLDIAQPDESPWLEIQNVVAGRQLPFRKHLDDAGIGVLLFLLDFVQDSIETLLASLRIFAVECERVVADDHVLHEGDSQCPTVDNHAEWREEGVD